MTVTLYEDTNYKGCKQSFARNKASLKDTRVGNNPSSIKVSKPEEAVLLFKKKDWRGSCLYVPGPKNVCNLGSKAEGGRSGFKNGVTSLRRTPFTLSLNVSMVSTSSGNYPGTWASADEAEAAVADIVDMVNQFYDQNRALLKLSTALFTPRVSNPKFVIPWGGASYPAAWKRSGTIDVVFVDSFKKEDASGRAKPPMFGETITIAARTFRKHRSNGNMARSLAHELGHYFGIHHRSANDKKGNIMYTPADNQKTVFDYNIRHEQIEDMHNCLSKNIARKGNR